MNLQIEYIEKNPHIAEKVLEKSKGTKRLNQVKYDETFRFKKG